MSEEPLYDLNCQRCRLSQTRTKVVPGFGPLNAKIMFIGEAPGREEDIYDGYYRTQWIDGKRTNIGELIRDTEPNAGKPFVGGAGNVLSAMLHDAGISRKEVYITNPVKCRPPNNRLPEADEVVACSSFLREEINRIRPELIIVLGDFASALLTGKDLSYRGCIVKSSGSYGEADILITYHPAYVMRKQSFYTTVVWDFYKAKDWLKGEYRGIPIDYWINEGLVRLISWENLPVAVDIETLHDKDIEDLGPNPFEQEIIGISLCGEEGKSVQFNGVHLKAVWPRLKEYLEAHPHLIFQNNLFDRMFLQVKEGINCKCKWDTQTGMHLIHSRMPKNLDFLRSLYTNIIPYKTKENYKHNIAHLNCEDTDVTLRVAKSQKRYLTSKQLDLMDKSMRADDVALKMILRGIKIDIQRLGAHYAQVQPTVEKHEKEFVQKYNCLISSPKQLEELLYKRFNLDPPWKARKKKSISTDEDTIDYLLQRCIGDSEPRRALLDIKTYREVQKIGSTYCEGIFKRIQEDGRLHTQWRPTGTDTGRWASRNPNLQNIPKHMRDMFIPEEKKIFFGADYNKIELMLAGIQANEYELVQFIENDGPLWEMLLEEVEKVYPLTRTVGAVQAKLRVKAVVYGTMYGRTTSDIALEFQTSPQAVQAWLDIFYGRFPKLRHFLEVDVIKEWKKNSYVEIYTGRRKYAEKPTEAKNFKVQGPAAEVMVDALISLDDANFNLVLTIHDQLVSEEESNEGSPKHFKLFTDLMETATPSLHNRFPVEGKMGMDWLEVS